jgi:hypothetical protein
MIGDGDCGEIGGIYIGREKHEPFFLPLAPIPSHLFIKR